jgi:glucosamine--fructose-6-phosphate aminotransferase (isomerizing)
MTSLMAAEAAEAPSRIAAQAALAAGPIDAIVAAARARGVTLVAICARGSSGHAATYAKYLFESRLGLPVFDFAPSLASLYGQAPGMGPGTLLLLISQSGGSPDLLSVAQAGRAKGALVVGLINAEQSPLAAACDQVLPLGAGPERSVAATKSYLCSVSAVARLAAAWKDDEALTRALSTAPEAMAAAWDAGAGLLPALDRESPVRLVLGRGLTFGAAGEAALKLMETCGLIASAFSAAEFRHGPMAAVGPATPVLALAPTDVAAAGVSELCGMLAERGAPVTRIACGEGGLPAAGDAALEPLVLVSALYRAIEALSRKRGFDPDRPPALSKVTRTL